MFMNILWILCLFHIPVSWVCYNRRLLYLVLCFIFLLCFLVQFLLRYSSHSLSFSLTDSFTLSLSHSLFPRFFFFSFWLFILISDVGMMVRVITNGPGDLGSIPARVIPKTQKLVLDVSLLNSQHYKIRIKGKVEQCKEKSSTLPYTLV